MFVGETGVGRVVQRTCELMREHRTDDVRKHGRHRPAHRAEVPQLPLLGVARSVRLGGLHQRRQLLHRRASRGASRRREQEDDHQLKDATYRVTGVQGDRDRGARGAGPALAERAAARRLHRRLPAGRRPLEQDHRQPRHRLRAEAPPPGLPPRHRGLRRVQGVAGRPRDQRGGVGRAPHEWLPTETRPGLRAEPHAAGGGARQVRQLDRAAPARDQRPARRLRVRPPGLTGSAISHERSGASPRAVQRRDVLRRPPPRRGPGRCPGVLLRGAHPHLRRRGRAGQPHRQRLPRPRGGDGGPRPHALPRRAGVPGRVLGRHQDRRRAHPRQHADARRQDYLYFLDDSRARSPSSRRRCWPRRAPCWAQATLPEARAGGGRRGPARISRGRTARQGLEPAGRPRRPRATTPRSGSTRRAPPASPRARCTCTTTW